MALGELVVKIVGDASDLQKELADAAKSSETFSTKARASLNAVGTAAGAMGAAAAAGMAVMIGAGMESAREIANSARLANASAEEFQAMAYAARSVGIEQDKLGDILKDVNDRIGDFITTGGGPMADFFERIGPRVGVTVDNFRKLSGPEALGLYVSSLEKANVSQQEMTFFLEAMASDSTALIPLLKDNAAGLNTMAAEARSLGLITSAIDIAKIEAARASMASVSATAEGFNRQLAAEAAPLIEAVADSFKEWAIEMGGFDAVARGAVDGIATGAGFVADVFRGWNIILSANIALLKTLAAEGMAAVNSIANASKQWTSEFWQDVDGLGEKLGISLDLSGAAAAAAPEFTKLADATAKAAADATAELVELMAKPLPSDELTKRIEAWREKSAAAAVEITNAQAAARGNNGSAPVDTGPKFTTTESDAGIEAIRQRLAERSKTFEAWRATQIRADGSYETGQIELFNRFAKIKTAELEAAQEREDKLLSDRRAKGLLDETQYNAMRLQLDRDHAAQRAEARAASDAEFNAMTSTTPPPIDPLSSEGADAVRAMRERLEGQAETMAEFNAIQLEQINSQQAAELAILQARRDADLLSTAEFEALKTAAEAEGAAQREAIAESERSAKLSIFGSMFDNVASLMQSGSRKMFEIGKAASIASGLVSAYESVMSAYAAGSKIGGPPLGAAYAAAAGIAQAGNLLRLKSASFGGGGSVSASGGGSSIPTAGQTAGQTSATGTGSSQAPQPSRNISISLAGSFFSADTVRELMTQINEQIGDGFTIGTT